MINTRVLLADPFTLFRSCLKGFLETEPDIEVVGEAVNGIEAVEKAARLRPTLVLIEMNAPGISGPDAVTQIKRENPHIKVLFLSDYSDDEYLVEALASGAQGYVLKSITPQDLVVAIRQVVAGHNYLSPEMVAKLASGIRTLEPSYGRGVPRINTLTTREREVLKMIAEGLSLREIASDLNLSLKTVEAHKFNLMRKLDIHNKTQLVLYAIEKKIIKVNDGLHLEERTGT